MIEDRHGIIGVPRTKQGDFVFLRVPAEDLEKEKAERLLGEQDYFVIQPDSLGFISGGIKKTEFQTEPGQWSKRVKKIFEGSFVRETQSEVGLDINEQAIENSPEPLGVVEQQRNGEQVPYLVWLLAKVLLNNDQVNALEGAEIVPAERLPEFLEKNKDRIRPVARAAAQRALEREQQGNKQQFEFPEF